MPVSDSMPNAAARPDGAPRPAPLVAGHGRLGHVDSLRLIAAALVLLQHLAERMGGALPAALIAPGPGVAGVVLFFLISGYVIPFSVRRGLDWRTFAVRRLLRIYPLYLVALALVVAGGATGILPHWADLTQAGAGRWLANLLLVQEFVGAQPILGVSWTLIIELAWYALFAAAVLLWRERAATVLAVIVPLSLLLLAATSLALGVRIPLARPGLIHAAVLGYQAWRFRAGLLSGRGLGLNIAAFLVVTWICGLISFGHFAHAKINLFQGLVPWTLATAVFCAVVLLRPLHSAAVLERGAIPLLGAASYSVYLLHPVAVVAAMRYAPHAAFLPTSLALTAALALAGYLLVERPGIALARWLTTPAPAPSGSAPRTQAAV